MDVTLKLLLFSFPFFFLLLFIIEKNLSRFDENAVFQLTHKLNCEIQSLLHQNTLAMVFHELLGVSDTGHQTHIEPEKINLQIDKPK